MKKLYCFLILLCCTEFSLIGQICSGNLGENIFLEGDFGSGVDLVLQTDPGIAPGYQYITNPPPADGQYLITNNVGKWTNKYDWLGPSDNSPDPNGYMMVINASFNPGLFYEKTVDGLCENTLYEFSVDVFNMIPAGKNYIKPNVSFLIDNNEYYTTGAVPENGKWNTYGFVFTTGNNQTQVTLSLKNNAPGGIGNDLALDNITFRPCGPEAFILPDEIANICEDGSTIDLEATVFGEQYDNPSFQWQESFDGGQTWVNILGANNMVYKHTKFASGYYYYRYLLANDPDNLLNSKCRVVSNVKIVHVVPKFYQHADTICQGLTYEVNGVEVNTSGAYVDSLISSIGCDSIVTLELLFIQDKNINPVLEIQDPSCENISDGSISVASISNGYEPYQVFLDGNLILSEAFDLPGKVYFLTILDKFQCSYEIEINLESPNPFSVDLGEDIELQLGDAIIVEPTCSEEPILVEWSPSGLMNCDPYCSALEFVPTGDMTLYVTAYSGVNCSDKDSINIRVEKVRKIYFPNVFTPNNDALNDRFFISGVDSNIKLIEEFSIYSRWGEQVYSAKNVLPNDSASGWDGLNRQGRRLSAGVYSYYAIVQFIDNESIIYKGTVTLIR